jgi:hypothetical protein
MSVASKEAMQRIATRLPGGGYISGTREIVHDPDSHARFSRPAKRRPRMPWDMRGQILILKEVVSVPTSYVTPEEYLIRDSRIHARVFAALFGPDHPQQFFLNPADSKLMFAGYRWSLEGSLSNRDWSNQPPCYMEEHDGAYWLTKVSHPTKTVAAIPVSIDEAVQFRALP